MANKLFITSSQSDIIANIRKQGGNIWAVGGAIRDQCLSKKPKDIDLATNLLPNTIVDLLSKRGYTIIPDSVAYNHGIIRIVDKDTGDIIDLATLRKDISCDGRHAEVEFTTNIEEDLARRDLTINAMASEIWPDGTTRKLIDPFGGLKSIKEKLIEFVGNPKDRIIEDALRMLRACRFTALDDDWGMSFITFEYIEEYVSNINSVSKERIRDEIIKAMSYDAPINYWDHLERTGLMKIVCPDLQKGVGCTQNHHHDFDTVWEHQKRALEFGSKLSDNPLLRLSMLAHDIAKPHTKSTSEDGVVHFFKHEIEGAHIMKKWMQEYKFSNKEIEYVTLLIRQHQFWFSNPQRKTIRKWLRKVGKDNWRDLLVLRLADRGGNLKKMKEGRALITTKIQELYDTIVDILEKKEPVFIEDLEISGDDIINLGIKPGPIFSTIFSNLLGIVHSKPHLNNKEWLTNYVVKHYRKD